MVILSLFFFKISLQTFHETFYDDFDDDIYSETKEITSNDEYKIVSILLNRIILDTLVKKALILQENETKSLVRKRNIDIRKQRKKHHMIPTYNYDDGGALVPYPRVGWNYG